MEKESRIAQVESNRTKKFDEVRIRIIVVTRG